MATTIIRSTDAAAVSASAILTGNAGSLIAVLDHALVTRLGWTKAFSGTNTASYRPSAGVRHYLDVNDNGPDATALGRNAQVRGYETMTAVATGTGLFPTVAQVATPVGLVKSTVVGTTARPWIIIGDDRTFYLFAESAGTDPPNLTTHTWTTCLYFGEFYSALTGDLYRSLIGWQSNTATVVSASTSAIAAITTVQDTGAANQATPRSFSGAGGSVWSGSLVNASYNTAVGITGLYSVFPNPTDGGLYMNAIDLVERGTGASAASSVTSGAGFGGIRGRLRGLYQTPYMTTGYNDQDTFSGAGDFAGKTFLILKLNGGMIVAETTAWAASS